MRQAHQSLLRHVFFRYLPQHSFQAFAKALILRHDERKVVFKIRVAARGHLSRKRDLFGILNEVFAALIGNTGHMALHLAVVIKEIVLPVPDLYKLKKLI